MTTIDMDMANALVGAGMLAATMLDCPEFAVQAVLGDGRQFTNQLIVRFPHMEGNPKTRGYLVTVTVPTGEETAL